MYNGAFNMSGEASIPAGADGKNDVYLVLSTRITVAGALMAATPVATITPSSYTANSEVLKKGASGPNITQPICNQFAVTPENGSTAWKIEPNGTNTGVLKK